MFDQPCNIHCPLKEKRIKGSLPEWINSGYMKLSKDRDHYYNSKAHRTNNPQDWLVARKLRIVMPTRPNYSRRYVEVVLTYRLVLWSTQRLSTFMSTQRISRHVDITFNISTKEQWKIKCQ